MVIDSLDAASDEPMQIRLTTSGQLRNLLLDPQLLKYILKHLLSNAIKYSPDNTPVELAVSASADHIEFQVRDQGIGIPESDRAHLFEPFARGSNVGAVGGTGLGLKIVQDCVQLHGGEISYESALGKGTTFTVSLPISGN
jgi:signal transduction histidine kinase